MSGLRSFQRSVNVEELKELGIYEQFRSVCSDPEEAISHVVINLEEVAKNKCRLGFSVRYKEGVTLMDLIKTNNIIFE